MQEINDKTFGDYSGCQYTSNWENIVLSGDVNEVYFTLARVFGDVESRLGVEYRITKKGTLLCSFDKFSWAAPQSFLIEIILLLWGIFLFQNFLECKQCTDRICILHSYYCMFLLFLCYFVIKAM